MLAVALRPIEARDLGRRAELRLRGARLVRAGTLLAWERDLCGAAKPCRCVGLIHGLGDSALTWDKVLLGKGGAPAPPRGVLLLAVALPGTDGSDAPAAPSGYAVPELAEAVRGALASRCPEWTLAGNSLGGWVAAWTALRWPEGIKELVLVNPAGAADPSGLAERTARTLADPTPEALKDFMARAYHKGPRLPERVWPMAVAMLRARPARAMVSALKPDDLLEPRASGIKAPTTILWGESDRVLPRAVGEILAGAIAGARFVPVPACGHLPQRECPAAVSGVLFH